VAPLGRLLLPWCLRWVALRRGHTADVTLWPSWGSYSISLLLRLDLQAGSGHSSAVDGPTSVALQADDDVHA
jgi:hypothetical protein